jgi:hypothetical protein
MTTSIIATLLGSNRFESGESGEKKAPDSGLSQPEPLPDKSFN